MQGPLRTLEDEPAGERDTAARTRDEAEEAPDQPILCRRCRARLSEMPALFPMDADRINRVFANPAGLLLEILTTRAAHNVVVVGPATTEFTWYQGYAWEVAYCGGCRAHVGWAFGAADGKREPSRFFGLLKAALVLG
jgi:cereblon